MARRLDPLTAIVYVMWVSGRFDLLVEVVCEEKGEFANFLNEHIHGQPDIAHVEVMTRIGMFKNQFLLKGDEPQPLSGGNKSAEGRAIQTLRNRPLVKRHRIAGVWT